jgi:ABC-type Fe3+ transport system substrate-binding protein
MRALSKPPRMPVLLIASLGCCTTLAHAESIDALYEKAKLEKTLVLYGAGPSGSHDRWIQDFQQRFPGVTVAFTGGLSNGLNQKIDQQIASRRMETDLAIFQTIQDFGKWKKAGALMLFKPEGSETIDPAYKDEDGAFTAVSVNTIVYAYNTALVAAAEVPKSALDFLKPRFEGQLITTDPTEDDAGLSVFNLIVEKYGWDYMDKYMAQKPVFVTTGHAAVSNAIAAGEKLATFDSTSTTPRLKQQGKPIEPVFSQADPTPVFLVGAAIFKDAPHPNAAKLYLTWYLAKEQQSRNGTFSPRADVPPPAGLAPLSSYNIDSRFRALVSDESRLTELRKRFGGHIARR